MSATNRCSWLALDVETNGLDMRGMVVRTIQLSWLDDDTGQAVGSLVLVEDELGAVDDELLRATVRELHRFVTAGGRIWSYGDFDARALEAACDYQLPRLPITNAAAFHHLVEPVLATLANPIKRAIKREFGLEATLTAVDTLTMNTGDPDFVYYAMLDAVGLRGMLEVWWQMLDRWGDDWDVARLEAWLAREATIAAIAAEIGDNGLLVDVRRLDEARRAADSDIAHLRVELAELAPGVNPNSAQQVIAFLEADGVRVPTMRRPRQGTYTKSVGKKALAKIRHRVADPLLRYRKAVSALNTVKGLEVAADIHPEDDGTKPTRTTYRPLGCRTSRWSSSHPNMQNLPKGSALREVFLPYEEDEDDELDSDDYGILESVRPRRRYAFVQADLSQIEYRCAAALSGDEAMMEAFQTGVEADGRRFDFHRYTARVLSAVDDPTDAQRSQAKGVGFGKLYGQSLATAAIEAGVSDQTMALRIARYDAAFPGLKRWCDRVAARAEARRLTEPNPYGRRFPVPAGYQAVNYLCQSTAREVFCDWLVAVHGLGYRIVTAVHDELVVEAPEDLAEAVGERIVELAAACVIPGHPDVPIAAEYHWSVESWGAVYRK